MSCDNSTADAINRVQVNLSVDPDLGTIYSVNVPVRRVKPQSRIELDADATDLVSITRLWEEMFCCGYRCRMQT